MPDELKSPQLLLDAFGEPSYVDPAERRAARAKSIARLRLLWNQRRRIFRITGAGFILFTVLALLIPKSFESTTRLMPPDRSNGSMAILGALSGKATPGAVGALADDFLGLKSSGDLFIGILKSRTVQNDLITKFDLRRMYHVNRWADARDILSSKTDISEDRKSGIISIRVTDHNPRLAAAMAQEYIDALNDEVTRLNTSSAHRERVFLEERLTQVQQDLEAAEKDFSQFASKNTALDVKEQGKAMIAAGASLEGQLIAAQTELEGLKQIYADNNIRVRSVQARIDELQRQMQKLAGTPEPATASGQQSNQPTKSYQLYPSIRQLPTLGVTWADLFRRAAVQEKVFETLTEEYELAKVEEAKETPSVKVLDAPDIPERGSPSRSLVVLIGTAVSLLLSMILVLGRARWGEVDSHDPGKLLAIEVFEGVKSLTVSNGSENGISKGMWRRLGRRRSPDSEKNRTEA